jgi:hypothetical protein
MAFVYKQLTAADSDMVDPEDFNTNMRELAGEFNGMLDRDNFKEDQFGETEVARYSFTRVYSHDTADGYTLDADTTSFQNGISYKEFEATFDGILICEWSGYVEFTNPKSPHNTAATTAQVLTIQMKVNGNIVGQVFRVSGGRYRVPLYMVGAIPVSPGRVIVEVSAMTGEMEHDKSKIRARPDADVLFYDRNLVVTHRRR